LINPFELSGPDFLLFYLCVSMAVILALWLSRRRAESGPAPKLNLSDPYLIAYLRGGENEVMRLAVVSLVERGLLIPLGTQLRRHDRATFDSTRIPIEYEILKKFGSPAEAGSIFKDDRLKAVCQPYKTLLEQAGLLPDGKIKRDRWMRFAIAAFALCSLSFMKVTIGLSRNRPVAFLVILSIVAVIATSFAAFPRLTARGKAMLADVQTIYGGLKDRAHSFTRGAATADALMLAAVFGVAALAPADYAYARTLFPQATSGGCGSSCGSSGSSGGDGGGGCGGGGCGGCGS
jgi:uncharacterized protein (TIGR04222 family)